MAIWSLAAASAYGEICDDFLDNRDQCDAHGSCYYQHPTCSACPDGGRSDHGATSKSDCWSGYELDNSGTMRHKKYYNSETNEFQTTKKATCKNNICTFECANDDLHIEQIGNTWSCQENRRECTGSNIVANSTCYEIWNPDTKTYDFDTKTFQCDKGYLQQNNPLRCQKISDVTCSDHLQKIHPGLVSKCHEEFKYEIIGNLDTTSDGTTLSFHRCQCASLEKEPIYSYGGSTQTGECKKSYPLTTNMAWDTHNPNTLDCICNTRFCRSSDGHRCTIPQNGYYYKSATKTCEKCPAGTTSNFGTDVEMYIKLPDNSLGINACYINRQTRFCDNAGCFSLPITDKTVYYHE